MRAGTGKPPRWSARALAAFENTLNHISADDPFTAGAVLARVKRSVALIQTHPTIGTPTATPGVRRYPIPNSGHVVTYRFVKGEMRILRWFRARQDVRG